MLLLLFVEMKRANASMFRSNDARKSSCICADVDLMCMCLLLSVVFSMFLLQNKLRNKLVSMEMRTLVARIIFDE